MLVCSCSSKLDIAPQNAIYEEQVIELLKNGDETAIATIKGMQIPMPKYLNFWGISGMANSNPAEYSYEGINWTRALMGNDIVYGNDQNSVNTLLIKYYMLDASTTLSSTNSNSRHWLGYAQAINEANKLFKYSNYIDPKTSESAKETFYMSDAYARVIRAYSYMCLMEEYTPYYGSMKNPDADNSGMSIYETYDPVQKGVARSTAKQTWDFIKKDLDAAYKDLQDFHVGITTDYSNGELEDIDLSVIDFLRARAGLLTEDWAYCKTACENIITSGKYSLIAKENWGGKLVNNGKKGEAPNQYDDLFVDPSTNAFTALRKNPECIFGFKMGSENRGSKWFNQVSNTFGSYAANTGSGAQAMINDALYAKFESTDCRKAAFLDQAYKHLFGSGGTVGNVLKYSSLKFAATRGLSEDGTQAGTDAVKMDDLEFCLFRLSEVYLMYAEACKSVEPLNIIRTARGASALAAYSDEALQNEWSMEMWGENGREYYNNKRWGKAVTRTGNNHWNKGTWSVANMTLPFPQREQEDNKAWAADSVNL